MNFENTIYIPFPPPNYKIIYFYPPIYISISICEVIYPHSMFIQRHHETSKPHTTTSATLGTTSPSRSYINEHI